MRRRHRRSTRPTISGASAPAGCTPSLANRPMDPRYTIVIPVEEGGEL